MSNNPVDLYLCAFVGVLGYVLGLPLEEHLRRALLISRGDPSVFFTRPLSLIFIIATVLILIVMLAPAMRRIKPESSGG